MEADADMNRDLDLVFAEAARVDDELGAHAAAVSASTESSAVDAVEKAHHDAMLPHMDELDHMLADMTTYCRHRETQERGRTHDMQAAMTSMRRELERHRAAPRPDLSAARTEEETHLREARAILTGLRDAGSAMRHEAGFYRCQHGNH
jgi:hypothetical protein